MTFSFADIFFFFCAAGAFGGGWRLVNNGLFGAMVVGFKESKDKTPPAFLRKDPKPVKRQKDKKDKIKIKTWLEKCFHLT